jgi:hypothetical protein
MTVKELLQTLGLYNDTIALELDSLFNTHAVSENSPIATWDVETEEWRVPCKN